MRMTGGNNKAGAHQSPGKYSDAPLKEINSAIGVLPFDVAYGSKFNRRDARR
jgi:hypothetical protein